MHLQPLGIELATLHQQPQGASGPSPDSEKPTTNGETPGSGTSREAFALTYDIFTSNSK
jgi:hypothetical protein